MAKEFNLSEIMSAQAVGTPRDIETITGEILELKTRAGESVLGIGQRLIEAKALLSHGEWLPWLAEKVEFSERAAQNFMRLSREWSNPHAVADLGARKALTLLALPADEREQFIAETHVVNGEEKTVIDMSARQLEQAIRERDEARIAAEQASADQKVAEESRAKMEEDMRALKATLDSVQSGRDYAEKKAAKLEQELADLKAKPIDVAVMAVDQQALDKARADAIAEMQAKVDKANEGRAKALEKEKALKASLAELQEKLEAAEKAEKRGNIAADEELAVFRVVFERAQDEINKLHGMLLKMRSKGRDTEAEKLSRALLALADQVRGCAG